MSQIVQCTHCNSSQTSLAKAEQVFSDDSFIDYRCNSCFSFFSIPRQQLEASCGVDAWIAEEEPRQTVPTDRWSPYSQPVNSLRGRHVKRAYRQPHFKSRWSVIMENRRRTVAELEDVDQDRPCIRIVSNPDYAIIETTLELKR